MLRVRLNRGGAAKSVPTDRSFLIVGGRAIPGNKDFLDSVVEFDPDNEEFVTRETRLATPRIPAVAMLMRDDGRFACEEEDAPIK